MYEPSTDQAERDRRAAFEAGVPHGVVFDCVDLC